MAKDYFQDIVPPEESHHSAPARSTGDFSSDEVTQIPINSTRPDGGARSIRDIAPPQRPRPRVFEDTRENPTNLGPTPRRRTSGRYVMWGIAAICVLLLAALIFVSMRPTRVTVQPRTHALTFTDETFSANPEGSGLGTMEYSVQSVELEDSEVVPSEGMVYGEDKATGNITIYNNFQTTPLKLVKNTRFASASGHVFRAPADIVVPAKQGNTPGKIEITVVADQPGEQYNVAPGKFTVPGLKSTPAMYAQVYAESTESFTGGFVGERPGVAAGALENAIAAVRARLESKAREATAQIDSSLIAFQGLTQIEYESLPNTTEAGGGVRIHQRARVKIPVFKEGAFAAGVGGSAVTVVDAEAIELIPNAGFGAQLVGTSTVLGAGPIRFSMSGSATLVWKIDEAELQAALAGKDKSAFEPVVAGIPSIQEATARIEPFWKSTFPEDPADIQIKVEGPEIAE